MTGTGRSNTSVVRLIKHTDFKTTIISPESWWYPNFCRPCGGTSTAFLFFFINTIRIFYWMVTEYRTCSWFRTRVPIASSRTRGDGSMECVFCIDVRRANTRRFHQWLWGRWDWAFFHTQNTLFWEYLASFASHLNTQRGGTSVRRICVYVCNKHNKKNSIG